MSIQVLNGSTIANSEELSDEQINEQLGKSCAECPPSTERDPVAHWIALQHLGLSQEITDVYYLPTGAPSDEIRLLEVNKNVGRPQDEITAVDFGLDIDGLNYKLIVADLSPAEFARLRSNGLTLPDGWNLHRALHWARR
jgi:hypothetical protein